MKLVYVAGPYRAETPHKIAENIHRARLLALRVWKLGAVAICPHMNTAHFDGECPDDVWLKGDLEILRRCDAVILADGWAGSSGTMAEVAEAERLGIPVVRRLQALKVWLDMGAETC